MNNNTEDFNCTYIAMFFALAILLGSIFYIPWVLASYGMFPFILSLPFFILGGASPFIAAFITTRKQFGVDGSKNLFRQFIKRETSMIYFIIPIILQFAIAISAILLLNLFSSEDFLDFKVLVGFIPILISLFLQNMWEEIGWRGYSLPALQEKFSALHASILIGLLVAIWHWPHFIVKDSVMMINYHNFLYFTIMMILISIQQTWLYNSSEGNLTVSTLNHSALNTFGFLFFIKQDVSYQVFPFLFLSNLIVTILITIIFKPDNLSRRSRQKLSFWI